MSLCGSTEEIMITNTDIKKFLNQNDYDIRKTHNGRWLDQKVTYDVSSMIADCVLYYANNNGNTHFNANDIWHSSYASDNILAIFNKPGLNEERMKNEYDKFFSQPLLFLASSKVLTLHKKGNRNFYTVNNKDMLEFIAAREYNAFTFTTMYIEKVMKDSGLWPLFDNFFNLQTKEAYNDLKDGFGDFLRRNTPITGTFEPNRIFTKAINPLAVSRRKRGTKGGHISSLVISLSDLQYNQANFRDLHTKKPKEVSRQDWAFELGNSLNKKRTTYQVGKAKSYLHRYNDKYRKSASELLDTWGTGNATQMHHIFPAADFPEISDSIENLIALTPTQHLTKAHPDNKTQRIDREYQKTLLLTKLSGIKENIIGKVGVPIYNFDQFVNVLSIGFDMEIQVTEFDYDTLEDIINEYYTK